VRKKVLPFQHQWWWTPFFDDSIQNVLEARFETGKWAFCETHEHALAWPLVAYEAMSEFAHSARPFKHGDFLQSYALDPEFSSALLLALTLYVRKPRENWSFDRRLAELDETKWDAKSKCTIPAKSWQEVVNLLEPNDRSSNRSKAFANRQNAERARRLEILRKWAAHFRAKESLRLRIDNYPLDVVPGQVFQIAYLPPQRLRKREHRS
jgi:hypothetical protein